MLDERGDAVAGDAGGRIDDGDAPAGEPVEQRRFADVGPADNGDDGNAHGLSLRNEDYGMGVAILIVSPFTNRERARLSASTDSPNREDSKLEK